jgi:nitrogen-specific signal transduction histidine kinase
MAESKNPPLECPVSVTASRSATEQMWLNHLQLPGVEQRLSQAAWAEDWATLAQAVTHDFCNLSTGLIGLSEAMEAGCLDSAAVQSAFVTLRNTALQTSRLAGQLHKLRYTPIGRPDFVDLNECVLATAELLRRTLPRRAELRTDCSAERLVVHLDVTQLQQAVLRLAVNAAEAMPKSGHLSLRTRRLTRSPEVTGFAGTLPSPPLVCLTISDSGPGIDPALLPCFFDPFFSTKPVGRATGLGLFSVRRFVERQWGAISIESQEGSGTHVHLWLPEANLDEAPPTHPGTGASQETLLVVEPEEALRNLLIKTARELGWQAVPAASVEDALRALYSPYFQYTAVLLSLLTARQDGFRFCQRLLDHPARVRIVVTGPATEAAAFAEEFPELGLNYLASNLGDSERMSGLKQLFARP